MCRPVPLVMDFCPPAITLNTSTACSRRMPAQIPRNPHNVCRGIAQMTRGLIRDRDTESSSMTALSRNTARMKSAILFFVLWLISESSFAAETPNILLIVADDLGFSDVGCYGGEIQTPNIDQLAAGGVRFTQFYNTARCWPTRSAILTGYYPQQIRMDPPHGRLPKWTRLLPHYLKPLGYRSYQSGKWHVNGVPRVVADGGFDHAFNLQDQNRYFTPQSRSEDDRKLPAVKPGDNYYATIAIADHAIRCLKEHAKEHAQSPSFSTWRSRRRTSRCMPCRKILIVIETGISKAGT